jgi:hypothetical protein
MHRTRRAYRAVPDVSPPAVNRSCESVTLPCSLSVAVRAVGAVRKCRPDRCFRRFHCRCEVPWAMLDSCRYARPRSVGRQVGRRTADSAPPSPRAAVARRRPRRRPSARPESPGVWRWSRPGRGRTRQLSWVCRGGCGAKWTMPREVVVVREPGDVPDLHEQPPRRPGGADAVQSGQGRSGRGEQLRQLLVRRLLPRVDPLQIADQLGRDATTGLRATSLGRTVASSFLACAADRSFFAPPGISSRRG